MKRLEARMNDKTRALEVFQSGPCYLAVRTRAGARNILCTDNEWMILFSMTLWLECGAIPVQEDLYEGLRRWIHNKL